MCFGARFQFVVFLGGGGGALVFGGLAFFPRHKWLSTSLAVLGKFGTDASLDLVDPASSHMLVSDSASHGWFVALVFGGLGSFSRGKVFELVFLQVGSDARPNLVDPASSHMLVSDSA